MSDRMARIGRYLAPLALMGAIFLVSAQPDLTTGLGLVDLIGRKVLHAAEYGALFWLWWRAFGFRRGVAAALITIAYAGTDEYHQTFVEGRHGTPVDAAIDAAGIPLALLADRVWRLRRDRRRGSEPAALGGDQHGLGPVDRAQLPVDVVEVGADGAGGER
jgi:VanZ like family